MPLATDDEGLVNLDVCSLDKPEEAKPNMHIYEDSRVSWYKIDDGLPRLRSDEIDDLLPVWKEERLKDG